MTPEGRIKKQIKEYLDSMRPDIWYYLAQDKFTIGIPDIIICYRGWFIALEVKRPEYSSRERKKVTLQKLIGGKIEKSGGIFEIVSSLDEVVRIFEEEFGE